MRMKRKHYKDPEKNQLVSCNVTKGFVSSAHTIKSVTKRQELKISSRSSSMLFLVTESGATTYWEIG